MTTGEIKTFSSQIFYFLVANFPTKKLQAVNYTLQAGARSRGSRNWSYNV